MGLRHRSPDSIRGVAEDSEIVAVTAHLIIVWNGRPDDGHRTALIPNDWLN
jgi:hypothetical protein